MTRFINYSLFLLLLNSTGCTGQNKEVRTCLRKCVDSTVEINKTVGSVYQMVSDIENASIEAGLIKRVSKEEYQTLIDKVYLENDSIFQRIADDVMIRYDFEYSINNLKILSNCVYTALITEKNEMTSTLVAQSQHLNQILYSGFEDKQATDELLEDTRSSDFEFVEYRAPIIICLVNKVNQR